MTSPSFLGMNALMAQYAGKDFVTLAFPAPDFFNQEAYDVARPEEFLNELKHVRPGNGFEPQATQIFRKIHVNGVEEDPVYTFFKGSCPSTYSVLWPSAALNYAPQAPKDIWWNYEKFLIARNGTVFARYSPAVFMPGQLQADIDALLAQEA